MEKKSFLLFFSLLSRCENDLFRMKNYMHIKDYIYIGKFRGNMFSFSSILFEYLSVPVNFI